MKILNICGNIFVLIESHLFLLFDLLQLYYIATFQILKELIIFNLLISLLLLYFFILILLNLHQIICYFDIIDPDNFVLFKTCFTLVIIDDFPHCELVLVFIKRIFWSWFYDWLIIYKVLIHQFALLELLRSQWFRFFIDFFLLEVCQLIFQLIFQILNYRVFFRLHLLNLLL